MKRTFRMLTTTLISILTLSALLTPAALAQMGSIFDQPAKAYPLTTGWFEGRQTHYYDFGSNSPVLNNGSKVARAPIFAFITGFDAQGNPQFVQGQHNIIDVVPGDPGYSDLWEVNLVIVPSEYVANTFKSADDVMKSGFEMRKPGLLVNCPVVPLNSTLAEPNNGSTAPTKGWYKGREVHYFDFGPNPDSTAPIFAFITGFDAQGNPQFVQGQHNIINVIPDMAGYSAFWDVNLVKVPANYKANSITSYEQLMQAGYDMVHPGIVVNCPVVRTDDALGGMQVGMPQTGTPSALDLLPWGIVAGGTVLGSGMIIRRRAFAKARVRTQ